MPYLLCAIAVLSAAAMGYEILLMRLLSIVQWHNVAYMIISLALLGFGASGTWLVLGRRWLLPHSAAAFVSSAVGCGVSMLGSFVLAQRLPLNTLEIVWDPQQWLYILALYLVLCVPFFCAATGLGLVLARFQEHIPRLYQYNLLGTGGGALGVVLALGVFSPIGCLKLLSTLGCLAASLASLEPALARSYWRAAVLLLCALALPALWPEDWVALRLSPYKSLSQALHVPDAHVLSTHSSPLGLLTVVHSPTIPFRHAPGLSINSTGELPAQLGMFTDGNALSVITRYTGQRETLAYLDFLTSALPYHLLDRPQVLILGAGGGADVLQALYHQARGIDAVELNAQVIDLVQRVHADFAGHLYSAAEVRVHGAEARRFVATSRDRYDLIQVPILESFGTAAAGVHALSESYLYTVEALYDYLQHLQPDGLLAITRWLTLPPRDSLKLFATAVAALERLGVVTPARQLALIHGWQTATLLVKHGEFTEQDIAALRGFCEARAFDVAYYPGMPAAMANRFNVLAEPYFFADAMALLSDGRQDFMQRYKFHLAPATDDRPYFFHFFRWRSVPEILSLRGQGGLLLLEGGYLILLATLLQATMVSAALIFLPLWALRCVTAWPGSRGRISGYFLALGLAFLFIEMAFIQRFHLFLGSPLYTVAVVLCAFLVFAGFGSGYATRLSQRWRDDQHQRRVSPVTLAVTGIALIALLYLLVLPPLFLWCLGLPDAARIVLTLALIAPLAFCMGIPFPLGLARVAARLPDMLPWAWALNGCASVLGAILATLLAIHYGFTVVVILALGLYVLAAALLRQPL